MDFSKIKTAHQWLKIGKKRRTGVLVPLFSIYSQNSIGIGEIPDLKLLADWCRKVNISIIQLLPLNDTGFKFAPYDTESSYAIDPMYICLSNLKGVESKTFYKEIELLKKRFKRLHRRVNYDIKKEKLKILGKMFDSIFLSNKKLPRECEDYIEKNNFWIRDYAIYKTLKDKYNQKPWEAWELKYKNREDKDISIFTKSEENNIKFYEWVQWQLYLQMIEAKKYANKLGVLIMGDLPLLISKDSADVWAHNEYFILDKSTGTPIDIDFIKGQRWGMPPYSWKILEENKFNYFSEKLKYAEYFYNIYRIDHFIGLFRLWVIDNDTPLELGGIKGKYTPENPELWKKAVEDGPYYLDDLLQQLGARPHLDSALGKREACLFFFPFLSHASSLERDHYFHRMALLLKADPRFLYEEFKQFQKNRTSFKRELVSPSESQGKNSVHVFSRQEYFVGLLLRFCEHVDATVLEVPGDAFEGTLKKVYNTILSQYNSSACFDSAALFRDLDEDEIRTCEVLMIFAESRNADLSQDRILSEMQQAADQIHRRYRESMAEQLMHQIRLAREAKDADLEQTLFQEYSRFFHSS